RDFASCDAFAPDVRQALGPELRPGASGKFIHAYTNLFSNAITPPATRSRQMSVRLPSLSRRGATRIRALARVVRRSDRRGRRRFAHLARRREEEGGQIAVRPRASARFVRPRVEARREFAHLHVWFVAQFGEADDGSRTERGRA